MHELNIRLIIQISHRLDRNMQIQLTELKGNERANSQYETETGHFCYLLLADNKRWRLGGQGG